MNNFRGTWIRLGGAIAALALASSAGAATTIGGVTADSPAPFDRAPPVTGQTLIANFDGYLANGYTMSGGHVTDGAHGLYSGTAAPPIIGTSPSGVQDMTDYLAVYTGETATLSGPTLKSLSVDIGSLDTYNYIDFWDCLSATSCTSVASFDGDQLSHSAENPAGMDNGDQASGQTNRRFFFTFAPGTDINQVTFGSTGNSFEFDNIAGLAVPEPATWAMMLFGLGIVGAGLRRNRRSNLRAAAAA